MRTTKPDLHSKKNAEHKSVHHEEHEVHEENSKKQSSSFVSFDSFVVKTQSPCKIHHEEHKE